MTVMSHDTAAISLLPTIIILTLGIIAALLARLAQTSPIIGYLLLGLGIAIWAPDFLGAGGLVALLAELGVVFLLFDIGLHFSLNRVREDAGDIFGFGPLQVVGGTVAMGGIALLLGYGLWPALMIGAILSLSSTAVVVGIIAERHQRTCPVGLTATSILVFQDVVAIFLLITANALSTGGALPALGLAIVKAAVALVGAVVIQRVVVRPLFAMLARHGGEEVFTATSLVIALTAAWAATQVGLSMTLGAFLAGMIIADSPFRPIIGAEIAPFKGLLIGFFFISVGASIDLSTILHNWPAILAVAVALTLAKSGTNALASLVFKWSVPGSVQLGVLLSQGSEFAFVILAVPAVRELVGVATASMLIAAVALTLALTPFTSAVGRRLAGRLRKRNEQRTYTELKPRSETQPVLIIGMGQVGRKVADGLAEFGIGYDAIDRDPVRLREAIADGYDVYYGDADDARFWRAVDMDSRKISVSTAARAETAEALEPLARTLFPSARHVAVVGDEVTATRLREKGIEVVVDRGTPRGAEAARYVLDGLGIAASDVAAWTDEQLELA
ncbi:MAG: Sodium/hydrogen exchanger [Bradyrhizobium sp.]|nr:Sodium/hydrogen exchanger [Bradyrhizobium sp.]